MKAGEAAVETLIAHGVDTVFVVPGQNCLVILEGLRKARRKLRTVSMRNGDSAAFAAAIHGKLMGRPAALLVDCAAGATSALIGLHAARADSLPLVLLIGETASVKGSLSLQQDVDYASLFKSLAKEIMIPETADSVISATARGVTLAQGGCPGPVVIVLARDIAEQNITITKARRFQAEDNRPPSANAVQECAQAIAQARKPVLIAGELVSLERANSLIEALAEMACLPVLASYRSPDVIDNLGMHYIGHIDVDWPNYIESLMMETDLLIAAGVRLDPVTSGNWRLPGGKHRMIHIFPDENVLSRFPSNPSVNAHVKPTLEALLDALAQAEITDKEDRRIHCSRLHAQYLAFSSVTQSPGKGPLDPALLFQALHNLAPVESVYVVDTGAFSYWAHRFLRLTVPHSYAGSVAGVAGYAIPGAIAASWANPGAPIFALAGDGGFMMSAMELATVSEHKLPVKTIIFDNGAHGVVLAAQRQIENAREAAGFATILPGLDYVAFGQAFGIPATSIATDGEVDDAIQHLLDTEGPALLHVAVDLMDISPFGGKTEGIL